MGSGRGSENGLGVSHVCTSTLSTLPYQIRTDRTHTDSQPGHGAPALLSTLYMEGSMEKFYPEFPLTLEGAERFIKAFSFPGGFPSHVNGEWHLCGGLGRDSLPPELH